MFFGGKVTAFFCGWGGGKYLGLVKLVVLVGWSCLVIGMV